MESITKVRSVDIQRLKDARDSSGLSTRQVAEKLQATYGLKISYGTIGNYERGTSSPSIELLQHLATLYGRQLDWFLEPGLPAVGTRFRKTTSLVTRSEEKQYIATATRWLDAYRRLEQFVGDPLLTNGFRAKENQTGSDVAREVRDILKIGTAPIPSVIEIIQNEFGIRVIELFTNSRIDAFAAKYGNEHAIVLNPAASNDRYRLNVCHEFGHVMFLDCGARLPDKEIERRAFDFAVCFLIPEERLREAFKGLSMVKLVEYKAKFGVSLAAMVYKAEKIDILDADQAQWLWRQFSIRGWRRNEPGQVRADRATRFERLFDQIPAPDSKQTKAEALRFMRVSEAEMRERVSIAAGGTPVVPTELQRTVQEEGGEAAKIIKFPE